MTSRLITKGVLKFVPEPIKKAVKTTARYLIANSKPIKSPCVRILVRRYPSLREHDHCVTIRTQMQWQPYNPENVYYYSLLPMHSHFHINNITLEQQQNRSDAKCKRFPTRVSGISYSNIQALNCLGTKKHVKSE